MTKPADQIIRLNINKEIKLDFIHPFGLPIIRSFTISNGGEGIVTLENNAKLVLLATSPSQLGKYTLKITLKDNDQSSFSETI